MISIRPGTSRRTVQIIGLADSVRSGRLRRAEENPDTFGGEHGIEGLSELAGAVPDQEMNGTHAMAQVHQEAPGYPRWPSQRIRAGRIKAQVKTSSRVVEPHRRATELTRGYH